MYFTVISANSASSGVEKLKVSDSSTKVTSQAAKVVRGFDVLNNEGKLFVFVLRLFFKI